MRVLSYNSGWSRNFYQHIKEGKITIADNNGEKNDYIVRNGDIVCHISKNKKTNTKDIYLYGHYHKSYKNNKLLKHQRYKRGSTQACIFDGVWESGSDKLYNFDVTYRRLCYGGSFRREIVRYKKSKQVAYEMSVNKKKTEVFYPNGKIWARFNAKIDFSSKKTILLSSEFTRLLKEEADFSNVVKGNNYTIEIYDRKGKVFTSGEVKDRQRFGIWILCYKQKYYLQGVEVSKRIYESDGKDLDPQEVLEIANVQLRSSLLEKIGLENVIKKVKGVSIDKDDINGYELISLPIKQEKARWGDNGDTEMRILKVKCPSTNAYYTLRVPPTMQNCEQARQWSFGVDNPKVTKEREEGSEYIELEKEV